MKHTVTSAELRLALASYVCERDSVHPTVIPRHQLFTVAGKDGHGFSAADIERLSNFRDDDVVYELEFYTGDVGQS